MKIISIVTRMLLTRIEFSLEIIMLGILFAVTRGFDRVGANRPKVENRQLDLDAKTRC